MSARLEASTRILRHAVDKTVEQNFLAMIVVLGDSLGALPFASCLILDNANSAIDQTLSICQKKRHLLFREVVSQILQKSDIDICLYLGISHKLFRDQRRPAIVDISWWEGLKEVSPATVVEIAKKKPALSL